jgi:glutamate/aspartate transport system substrate-binding protein
MAPVVAMAGIQFLEPARAQPAAAPPPAAAAASAASAPKVMADTVSELRRRGVIRLGHREQAVPFSYLVEGQPRGYAVDLCLRLVEGLRKRLDLPGLKVEWVALQPAERLPATTTGRIDLECGNTTASVERRKTVAFTAPIFIAGAGVLVRTDLAGAVGAEATLRDLRGRRIAVSAGTNGEKVVRQANQALYGLEVVIVKDNAEAFGALQADRADAWITDDVLLASFRARAPDPKRYLLLNKRHTVEPLALMHRKDDPAFERAVDAEMSALFRSGQVEDLYQRWFQRPIPPGGQNMGLPPSRLLKEVFRMPLKMQQQVDVVVL